MTTEPLPGSIVKTIRLGAQGITEFHLSNGTTVILKSTDYKNDEIRFAASASGGTSVYRDAEFINASYAGMISNFGLAELNPSELNQTLTGKQVSISPFINERFQGLDGTTTPEDLKTAMQLYTFILRSREKTKRFLITISPRNRKCWPPGTGIRTMYLKTALNLYSGNYSLRRKDTGNPDLKKINLDELYRMYKSAFGCCGFYLCFCG